MTIVERSFLVRVVQRWEGENLPSSGWPIEPWLDSEQDQHVCDNWRLVSDVTELLDDDQLVTRVVEK